MNTEKWFKDKLEEFKEDADFYAEELILEFTEQVVAAMKTQEVNRTELANRLGVSKAFVTKLLNGNTNITLRTMASLAKSIGCNVNIDICPKGFHVKKIYYSNTPKKTFSRDQFTKLYIPKINKLDNNDEYQAAA